MAVVNVTDRAGSGLDMSHWKGGIASFSTVGSPDYYLDSSRWLDYNTVETWWWSPDTKSFSWAYILADDVGTGMIVRDTYYYNSNGKTSLVLGDIDLFVSYADLNSGATNWFAFGLGGADVFSGNKYRDIIKGAGGNDRLLGNGGNDRLFGERGNDSLSGHSGADFLSGGSGLDKLYGGFGNDKLSGGQGNDKLVGGNGNDKLVGGNGSDKLYGHAGKDTLVGGVGKDALFGGGGADVFEFSKGCGADRIKDFQNGIDHIRIGKGASKFGDLDITKWGNDTVVEFANVSITFEDTTPRELNAADFWF